MEVKLRDVAVGFATKQRWPVFPIHFPNGKKCSCGKPDCDNPAKHPRTPHGVLDATTDDATVDTWWKNTPQANIGIRTGEVSKIVVVDIDPKHGGNDSLAKLEDEHGKLSETVTAETGSGGTHYFFEYPDKAVSNRTSVREGIDVRGDNGYVVAPGSTHACGGTYKWKPGRGPNEIKPAAMPAWLLDVITERDNRHETNGQAAVDVKPGDRDLLLQRATQYVAKSDAAKEGDRNNKAFNLAGNLASFETDKNSVRLTSDQIVDLLRTWNHRNQPPLSEGELRQAAESAYKGNGSPRAPHVVKPAPGKNEISVDTTPKNLGIDEVVSPSTRYTPFPVHWLPEPVRGFVERSSTAIGCEESYVGLPLLTCLASAIGATYRIELKPGWCEPSVVWGGIVGESGQLKSPALASALEGPQKRQAAAFADQEYSRRDYEQHKLLYEADLQEWKRKGRRNNEPPPEPLEEPEPERCVVNDITVEALVDRLSKNPRGLLAWRDELAGWVDSFDQYKGGKGSDTAHWLSMHRAEAITLDRKSGLNKATYVPRAAVSVVGGIQPGVLRRVLGRDHFEDGLAARVLMVMPPPKRKRWTSTRVSDGIREAMNRVFNSLYSLDFDNTLGYPRPVDVPLTKDAQDLWIDFYNQHGDEQANLTGDLAAAWAKIEGYAARLSLVIYLTRWAATGEPVGSEMKIDAASVAAGVTLARWFGSETSRIYGILAETDDQRDCRLVFEFVSRHGGQITTRELQRNYRPARGSAEKAEALLNQLATAKLGKWADAPTGPDGGRPTRIFTLPTLSTVTQPSKPRESGGCVDTNGHFGTDADGIEELVF